ncbi:MAG: hypothetical protein SH857_07995 [Chitinophagales bacterium]|nr:hypothetical protein [Chitinophagales bacterium]
MLFDLKKFVATSPEKFERGISRIEIVGLLVTMIGVALMTKKIPAGYSLLNIGLSTLAAVYLFLGVTTTEIFKLQSNRSFAIAMQISYTALAVTMMGMLFTLMHWPGAAVMMQAGGIVTGLMFAYCTYKMYFGKVDDEAHRVIINNLIVRMLPALLVAAVLIMLYLKK